MNIIANEQITAKNVRLVNTDENFSDVMAIEKAIDYAYSRGLDLVQIDSNQKVPVVKPVDLNKYKYELNQAEKTLKKKQRQNAVQLKEVQFSFNTQENDLRVKLKSAKGFLESGKNVRLVMKVGGRLANAAIIEQNKEQMKKFVDQLGSIEFVQKIEMQGKNITCIVSVSKKSK